MAYPKFTLQQVIDHQKRNGFGPISGEKPATPSGPGFYVEPSFGGEPKGSNLERTFVHLWVLQGGPTLQREVGLIPGRLFRVDFLHQASKTVLEIEGYGIGHFGKAGFKKDADKYFALQVDLGYKVIRLTKHLITEENIVKLIKLIEKACSISEKE